jgi:PAS domain S-box-containing protein
MFTRKTSIRQKIIALPFVALLVFAVLVGGDHFLKEKIQSIVTEHETSHKLSLLLSELLHLESDYFDSGNKNQLVEIKAKNKHLAELLSASRLNNKLYVLYNKKNVVIQKKVDEITLFAFDLLLDGKDINSAKREFGNSLKEFSSLDALAMLNTTELYHLSNEQDYLAKEKILQERIKIVARASDALSFVTEDVSDRDVWAEIAMYQQEVNSFRNNLYKLWQERQEITTQLPVTHEALERFSSYIHHQAQDKIHAIETFHYKYNAIAILFATFFLALVSYFVIRNIVTPITKLTEVTEKIRDGDLDAHVEVTSHDELRILADTFNDMVSSSKVMTRTLEENELKFRQLLESTSTIPWELDLESLQFTYIGNQVEKILGYPVESWIDFDIWAERIHPEDREYAIEYCKSATERSEDHDFTYRAIHQNGSTVWIQDIVSVVSDNGKPHKLVGFMHDISVQRSAEEEKVNLEERLQQAQKMEAIGTLAGGIAHDFNNILGVILGYAGMAKEDASPGSSIASDLDKVLDAGYRAQELVKQILAFSRQSTVELRLFKPVGIIKEAVKMLRSSIPSTITIHEKINPDCATILGDPTQVHQIVMNICTNAYHAMEDTCGKLEISLNNVEITRDDVHDNPDLKDGKFVLLTITDDGPGIDPAIQDKIFDPYFTTKETGKGTGMGLAIVHGIIKSYGGMIDFESSPTEGTTFHVYFPCSEQKSLDQSISDEPVQTGKERILFVDDEQFLVEMAREMLSRLGYSVTTRINSLDALQTFQEQPDQFDLVITDQTMPEMTGEDMARRMLQIRPDIPIILCTGFSAVTSEEKAKAIGIREFVMKPLIKNDIAKLIRRVMES